MITVSNVAFQFGGQLLFKDVDLKFTPGNCYGIIGANGAGKSTFLRILCGELQPTKGEVTIPSTVRMSVLKQDHFAYEEYTVLDTVIMGNKRLYDIMKEKDALYAKEDFTDEDGIKASELEGEFAELNGWEAESDASKLIQGLGHGLRTSLPIISALFSLFHTTDTSLTTFVQISLILITAELKCTSVTMSSGMNPASLSSDLLRRKISVTRKRLQSFRALFKDSLQINRNHVRRHQEESFLISLPSKNFLHPREDIPLSDLIWIGKRARKFCTLRD